MNDFVLYVSICLHINTLSTLQLHTDRKPGGS